MRILIAIPLIIILIAFALSNQEAVQLGLWPTDIVLQVPLSVAVLAAAGIFFVVGAFVSWGGSFALRSRARRAEQAVRRLEAQIEAMKARPMVQVGAGQLGAGQAIAVLPPVR